ncbi:MAG: hybrid sensor histidine kinase/response regulator [Candidatus Omnitrophota bacterium]
MNAKDEEFFKKLLATFKIEAAEHRQALTAGLLELEKTTASERQKEIIETIFRETHSLKGAARAVNLGEIETLCQSIENVFSSLKRDLVVLSPALFDALHEAINTLDGLLTFTGESETGERFHAADILENLECAARSHPPSMPEAEKRQAEREISPPVPTESAPSFMEPKPALVETVRISTARLNSILLQSEELIFAKLAAAHRVADLKEIHGLMADWKKEWIHIYPEISALLRGWEKTNSRNSSEKRHLAKLQEFLDWNHHHAQELESRTAASAAAFEQDHLVLGRMIDNLLGDMKKTSMFPFHLVLEVFPKLVRDLSREQGKEAELTIQGGEIEIDRRILEEFKDPFLHMVRNCIDHGIETPKERLRKKKAARGVITLAISQIGGGHVEMRIADDGAGIDAAKVKAAAVKLGILSSQAAEALDESGVHTLIFHSGVSTSPVITDISGRGLGLAIVREKVEELGGSIAIESRPGEGTAFRIVLPMTLAAYRGIMVRVNERFFVFPTTNVERVLRIHPGAIRTVENQETIAVNGQAVSLVRLGEALEMPSPSTSAASGPFPLVLLHYGQKRMAFLVDEILEEQEVLVKNLGPQLTRVKNIDGATILGAGKVVPILNVSDLMKSAAQRVAATRPGIPSAAFEEKTGAKQSILVVEDSITARTLLKNILETAGYEVKTAVDGIDAFTQLRTAEFNMVVSDVDMPRMNGFELTAKIRSEKKLAEMPVVLVTALQSREDRERGIDAGANAYIVKSSFDQSNLLEIIRRLI